MYRRTPQIVNKIVNIDSSGAYNVGAFAGRRKEGPMPRSLEMTWVGEGTNRRTGDSSRRSLWRKVYNGVVYTISCKQLREQGYEVLANTKAGSYLAANAWWHKKRSELDATSQPRA